MVEPPNRNGQRSALQAAVAATIYCFVSITCNDTVATITRGSFPYPVFICWLQQIYVFVLHPLLGFMRIGMLEPTVIKPMKFLRLLPVGLMFCLSIGAGFVCLKHLGVAEYDIAKGMILFFSAFLSWIILGTRQSKMAMLGVFVVTSSFFLNTTRYFLVPTSISNLSHLLWGVSASFFGPLHAIFCKLCMGTVNNSSSALLYYTSFMAIFLYLPFICMLEMPVWSHVWHEPKLLIYPLMPVGLLGVAINGITSWCIVIFSPLSYNTLGQMKNFLQSVWGIIRGNPSDMNLVFAMVLKLCGSIIYVYAKHMESSSMHDPSVEALKTAAFSEDGTGNALSKRTTVGSLCLTFGGSEALSWDERQYLVDLAVAVGENDPASYDDSLRIYRNSQAKLLTSQSQSNIDELDQFLHARKLSSLQ